VAIVVLWAETRKQLKINRQQGQYQDRSM